MRKFSLAQTAKWIQGNWYWLVFVVLILIPVGYAKCRYGDESYRDGMFGNWLATLLGVIAGVPFALALERHRISREVQQRDFERRERARKVLRLIADELAYNSLRLADRQKDKTQLSLYPFKKDLWQALSDGGEIRWVDDPTILDRTASAYHYISVVSSIEEKCYQAARGINPRYDDGTFASQRLLEDARRLDARLGESITAALEAIRTAVGDEGTR